MRLRADARMRADPDPVPPSSGCAPGVLALTTTGSDDVQALRSGDVFDVEYIQCGKQFKKLGRYVVNQVSSPSVSHSVKSIPVCLLPLRL